MRRTYVSFAVLSLLLSCAMAAIAAPKPQNPQLTDIPGDDGTNVVIKWKHFETVPGILYEIYRTEEGGAPVLITPLQMKKVNTVWENTTDNDVKNLGYLVSIDSSCAGLPKLIVTKPTVENAESLMSHGAEQLVRIEFQIPPQESVNALPNVFVDGLYYQVVPDMRIAEKLQPVNVMPELFAKCGFTVPQNGKIGLEVSAKDAEFEFVKKGSFISTADGVESAFLAKYGKKIASVVTTKARYTMQASDFSFVDRSAAPGKKYTYTIRLYQKNKPAAQNLFTTAKIFDESAPVEIITKDEPPFAPVASMVLFDTTSNTAAIHFNFDPAAQRYAQFFDNAKYRIFKTTAKDTSCKEGTPVGEINASWMFFAIKDVKGADRFYIENVDKAGQSTKTTLLQSVPAPLGVVPIADIVAEDFPNDDGTKLLLRWGPPALTVAYSVEDAAPTPKIEDVSAQNLYYVKTDTSEQIIKLEPGAAKPEGAQKISTYAYTTVGDKRTLKIEYNMLTNSEDDALYGDFTLGLPEPAEILDKDNTFSFKFDDVPEGKYRLTGKIIRSNGGSFNNPEAVIDMEIDATKIHIVDAPSSEYTYLFYRGTDKNDLSTFELFADGSFDNRQIIDQFEPDTTDKSLLRIFRNPPHKKDYYYIVQVVGPDGAVAQTEPLGPVVPQSNWFNTHKVNLLIATFIFVAVALFFILLARKGSQFFIRPIAGIVHIDEALGRATEMGRPIVYVTGLGYIEEIATLASLTILGRVAKKSAQYQNRLLVPCYDPIIMIVAQETVRNAYTDAGRPDLYREDDIYYFAAQQFAYAAAVAGLMIREKTAANFFVGKFYAESLILAETGASTGAIQVAGTDDMTQLPFFITACDYTLIGEELYAASAYMSNDPMQRGSLKSQDVLKAIEMVIIVIGTAAASAGAWWLVNIFQSLGE